MLEGRFIPASEAARRLGIDDSRVRRLAGSGELAARKVANRWFVDAGDLERRVVQKSARGRPLESENVWALLFLKSGEELPWIRPAVRSRILHRAEQGLLDVLPRLRRRADVRFFRGGELVQERLERDPEFVRSGVSAAQALRLDIKASGILDGYMPARRVDELVYRYALRPSDERSADLVLRSVHGTWPFDARSVAPLAAVAADLAESVDERSRRVGRQLLRRLSG